jgi:hypothetical protein
VVTDNVKNRIPGIKYGPIEFFYNIECHVVVYMQLNCKQSITLGNSNWSNLLGIHCWIFLSIIVALFNMFTS